MAHGFGHKSKRLRLTAGAGADTVLWRFHGCIAHAPDPATAFDRIHVLDKAARMVLMCMASGEPWEGLDAS